MGASTGSWRRRRRGCAAEALRTLYLTPGGVGEPGGACRMRRRCAGVRGGHGRRHGQQQLGDRRRPHASRASRCCAGDPHQPFWVPSSWYEFALHGPEDDAAGAGHPGFPGLWWGSNGSIAWGITNNAASTRDLYREAVDPDDPGRYRDGNEWRRFARADRVDPGTGRGGACADGALDGARSGGERADHAGGGGRRSAAVAALGGGGAPGRHAAR